MTSVELELPDVLPDLWQLTDDSYWQVAAPLLTIWQLYYVIKETTWVKAKRQQQLPGEREREGDEAAHLRKSNN